MLDVVKKVRNTLLADATMISYLNDRIYTAWKPVIRNNSEFNYPQITLQMEAPVSDSVLPVYYQDLNIHVWSKTSWTNAKLIAKRVMELLNQQSLTEGSTIMYRLLRDGGTDPIFEDDTKIWHGVLTFIVVVDSY